MDRVQPLGPRDGFDVPLGPATRLVTTQQQDGDAARVEHEQDAKLATGAHPKLFEVAEGRVREGVHRRATEGWPALAKPIHRRIDTLRLLVRQARVPIVELVGDLDLLRDYSVNVIAHIRYVKQGNNVLLA